MVSAGKVAPQHGSAKPPSATTTQVLPNTHQDRTVTLHNMSAVEAKFRVVSDAALATSPFRISPSAATIPPSSSMPVKVRPSRPPPRRAWQSR